MLKWLHSYSAFMQSVYKVFAARPPSHTPAARPRWVLANHRNLQFGVPLSCSRTFPRGDRRRWGSSHLPCDQWKEGKEVRKRGQVDVAVFHLMGV